MERYFNIVFFCIKTFFFFSLLIKLLAVKIYKHKNFTAAGICYFSGIFFMCLFGLLSIVPFILKYVYGIPGAIWYFALTVFIGELISCGVLGIILHNALKKTNKF